MWKKVVSGALAAGAVIAVSAGSAAVDAPGAPVKIGVMLCLSGDCAEWGVNGRKGAELAIEELNRSGGLLGRPVEAAVQDSHDIIPSRARAAYQLLADDPDVNFIVGPTWTVAGLAIAPLIAAKKDLIVTSPSVGVRQFNESGRNIFNTWAHDEKATRALARYAFQSGMKTAAILGSQDPWVKTQSDTFEEEFKRAGGTITARVEPLASARELRAEVLKVKASAPAALFLANYQTDVIAKEMRAMQFAPQKLAILMEKARVVAAEGALEGTIFAQFEKPAESFRTAFVAKYGEEPGITADTAYDAVMTYATAVRSTGGFDAEKLKESLHGLRDFGGASGTFSFDELGAVSKEPVLWKVKGTDYERVAK